VTNDPRLQGSCNGPGPGGLTIEGVVKIVDSLPFHLPNSAESAEKPLPATLLAEPFPGTSAQGIVPGACPLSGFYTGGAKDVVMTEMCCLLTDA
jgi:hypothetical protein